MDGRRRTLFKLGGLLGAAGMIRQARADDNTDNTVAGSWMVQIAYDDTTDNQGSQATQKTAMCQFFDDGRWVGSVSGVNPGFSESWPANWRQATYHGEWQRRGNVVTVRANRMRTDDAGNFVANATTNIQATLSPDGQQWTGTFVTVSRSLTASGTFTGGLSATRM
jgi:hypothetical protein